jgi:hypothetical protein
MCVIDIRLKRKEISLRLQNDFDYLMKYKKCLSIPTRDEKVLELFVHNDGMRESEMSFCFVFMNSYCANAFHFSRAIVLISVSALSNR